MLQTISNIAVIIIALAWLENIVAYRRHDSTDPQNGRSRLILYTDAATGVQYVGTVFGGLAPRVDRNGNPFTKE